VVAVKVGEMKHPDGNTYPTFAVIEPQTGEVFGQFGGPGTQINDADYMSDVESAVVFKDYVLTKGVNQLVDIKSTEIYTFTATRNIQVNNAELLEIGGETIGNTMTTGLPPTIK